MKTIITNIKKMYQVIDDYKFSKPITGSQMNEINYLENAYLIIEDKHILDYGSMSNISENQYDIEINASNSLVLPAWIDSHTHLVFAASREQEFVDRINGLTYEEIANRGGGILNSAAKMRQIDESELYDISLQRLMKVVQYGTGAIEIKSGYGLNLESELKMLRVIRKLKENTNIPIKASFLAAHTYPIEYKQNREDYLKLIINEMLPKVSEDGLADYIDVFCEHGFFSVDDTARLLEAGQKFGLKPKIHANQLYNSGGVQVGVKYNAVSVDHLECVGQDEIDCLKSSSTISTLLPGAAFFLGLHYQPARLMIDAGLPVCLASDYNPGSCPSGNMNTLASIACTQLKMTPTEVVNAMTINAAAALEMNDSYGVISRGMLANLVITNPMDNIDFLPYDFGNNPIKFTIINGSLF